MLLVKTKIAPSEIEGIGLFADQFIPKDTIIWKFKDGFDLKVSKKDINSLSEFSKEQFKKYCYQNKKTGLYVLCFDDARFFNHSSTPNCIGLDSIDEEGITIAGRNIKIGEELTCDYEEFDKGFGTE